MNGWSQPNKTVTVQEPYREKNTPCRYAYIFDICQCPVTTHVYAQLLIQGIYNYLMQKLKGLKHDFLLHSHGRARMHIKGSVHEKSGTMDNLFVSIRGPGSN